MHEPTPMARTNSSATISGIYSSANLARSSMQVEGAAELREGHGQAPASQQQ